MKRITVYELAEGWVAVATDGKAGAAVGPITQTPGETFGQLLADIMDPEQLEDLDPRK